MIIFYDNQATLDGAQLDQQESKHCTRVLRKKVGDEVYVTNGKGKLYAGNISETTNKSVKISNLNIKNDQEKPTRTAVAIAPTKNNTRLEWFIEKSIEIGITDIHPMVTKRTEKNRIKYERLHGIMIAAMKQSKNFHLPQLHELMPIEQLVTCVNYDNKFIAHCMNADQHLLKIYDGKSSSIILVGPEGDFTSEEVILAKSKGFAETNLGASRLRTETAGIVSCHLMQLALQKYNYE